MADSARSTVLFFTLVPMSAQLLNSSVRRALAVFLLRASTRPMGFADPLLTPLTWPLQCSHTPGSIMKPSSRTVSSAFSYLNRIDILEYCREGLGRDWFVPLSHGTLSSSVSLAEGAGRLFVVCISHAAILLSFFSRVYNSIRTFWKG